MGCTTSMPKSTFKIISEDVLEDAVGSYRDAPPAHFIYKIDSFSCVTNHISSSFQRLETTDFEVGGYKWKLSMYPDGDKNKNVEDHLSVYLGICETSSLPAGWEVNVVFRFFLLDQIRDKYLMLGDIGGRAKRFHELKTEIGFSKLISIATFNDPSNGYLMDDKCVFGAEVLLVPRSTGYGERLSMVKTTTTKKTEWEIQNFSQINEEFIYTEAFVVGNYSWRIKIYPKGKQGTNKSISLYLCLDDSTNFTHTLKVYTQFQLLVKNQNQNQNPNVIVISFRVHEAKQWFCASSKEHGWEEVKDVAKLTDKDSGYLVDDTLVIGAEITVLGVVQKLP